MIRPHELHEKIIHDTAAQLRYVEHIDNALSLHDFDNVKSLYIPDLVGVSLADRAVVVAKYGASYRLPSGKILPGWNVKSGEEGVFFTLPSAR